MESWNGNKGNDITGKMGTKRKKKRRNQKGRENIITTRATSIEKLGMDSIWYKGKSENLVTSCLKS